MKNHGEVYYKPRITRINYLIKTMNFSFNNHGLIGLNGLFLNLFRIKPISTATGPLNPKAFPLAGHFKIR